jgi:hypothetical protein
MKPESQAMLAEAERIGRALDVVVARLPWRRRLPLQARIWYRRTEDRAWWWLRRLRVIRDQEPSAEDLAVIAEAEQIMRERTAGER